MSASRSKYNYSWEHKRDRNGCLVADWGRKESNTEMFWKLCLTKFSISTGFQSVQQHSQTVKHLTQFRTKLSSSQLRLQTVGSSGGPSNAPSSTLPASGSAPTPTTSTERLSSGIRLYSLKDNAITAELLWVLKCVKSNYSFASCDHISDLFRSMFPNENAVPKDFSLAKTKATYLLTEALAPYFQELLQKDISNEYFTLLYDETVKNANQKELQTAVRYFSPSLQRITAQHLKTFFIGRAAAEDLKKKIYEAMDWASLPKSKLLMRGSDGPNVNRKVEKLVNEDLRTLNLKLMADMGTCTIHILHNAFLRGLEAFGMDCSVFLVDLHNFFDGFPSRVEDFQAVRSENWKYVPEHQFMKHVSSRWLTLEPAAERALEQMEPLKDYILKFIPQKRSAVANSKSYIRLRNHIKNPSLVAQLHFVICSALVFTAYTGLFQRDEPLVHVRFQEMERLARILMGRVCTVEVAQNPVVCKSSLDPKNLRAMDDVICGDNVDPLLQKVSEKD